MSDAAEIAQDAYDAVVELGAAGVLVIPNGTYDDDGSVTESATRVAVTLAGPVEQSQRYAATGTDSRVTATFHLAALGLSHVPKQGCRIEFGGRVYSVYAVGTASFKGTTALYTLDVGEID